MLKRMLLFAACAVLWLGLAAPANPATDITLPARGAFYYPWFPETWSVGSPPKHVFYHPVRGYYDSSDPTIVADHVYWLNYAKVKVGIASWWGQSPSDGHQESTRIPLLLNASTATPLKWALYYEKEGFGNPTPAEINGDLAYIGANYASRPEYASVGGKPVIFVYNADDLDCTVVDKWVTAAAVANFYVVLKVFPGFAGCANQPDSWHQYGPAGPASHQTGYSYTISPGFWRADEPNPRLARDLGRFRQNTLDMVASGEPWQLVTTFNEWGEGTAVEAAGEWLFDYLHVLATDGAVPIVSPTELGKKYVSMAGDIACGPTQNNKDATRCHQLETSLLLHTALPPGKQRVDLTLGLGDVQYETGSFADYSTDDPLKGYNFNHTWGATFRDGACLPTDVNASCYYTYGHWPNDGDFHTAVGNHEYGTPGASVYWDNFGEHVAGPRGLGYYAFNLGPANWPNTCDDIGDGPCYAVQPYPWRVIVLNSQINVAVGSTQYNWLTQELAANTAMCELVVMHHPPFSGGPSYEPGVSSTRAIYGLMDANGVDLVITGHEHNYQRFAQQDMNGVANPLSPTPIVVGTGGRNHSVGTSPALTTNLVEYDDTTWGIGRLELTTTGWTFRFIPEAGFTYTDMASGTCQPF